jgi:hypothetical protein
METGAAEPAVKARTAKALALLSLKRTFDLFAGSFTYGQRTAADTESQKMKLSCKVHSIKAIYMHLHDHICMLQITFARDVCI